MHIFVVGLNANNTPLAVRETLAFPAVQHDVALAQLHDRLRARAHEPAPEVVILSTCHRVEIYAACADDVGTFETITRFLYEFHALPDGQYENYVYRRQDDDAVRHLLRVTAGLDSPVLGETQILGQVAEALAAAQQQGRVGPYLSPLFQRSLHAAKRVHHETGLGQSSLSVGRVAATMALRLYQERASAPLSVLIVGAGKMAELTGRYLRQQADAATLRIVNRSAARGLALADRLGATWHAWPDLPAALAAADIVVCATSAPHILLNTRAVSDAVRQRPQRPLIIADISVPRNVAADVAALPNVSLLDVDVVGCAVDEGWQARQSEIAKADAILSEAAEDYLAWRRERRMAPVIRELRAQAEAIRQQEVARFLGRLGALAATDEERRHLDALTQRLMNRLLHLPTVRLKEQATDAESERYRAVVCDLFGLDKAASVTTTDTQLQDAPQP